MTPREKVKDFMFENLNEMAREVHSLAREKGWYDEPESHGQFLARSTSNMHSELSERWEAFRSGDFANPCDKAEKMASLGIEPLTCAEEESADLLIRLLDDCAFLGIDIGKAVKAKHAYNATRPYRHGGKKA